MLAGGHFMMKEDPVGYNVFNDDWDRLESGELYLSDCTGLDRNLDRQLIEYIAIHGQGWWLPKFRRRYRITETFPDTADKDDPGGYQRTYRMIKEQAARENDRETLKKAAFRNDENGIARFAFCRLTGYSWGDRGADDIRTYWCGLKSDMLREDIEAFCREMLEKEGPFACEAKEWLAKLKEIPDETLDEWAEGETERAKYRSLQDELKDILRPADGSAELRGEELENKVRSIFDAYIMMLYEERCGKVTREKKYRLMDPFTRSIFRIMKKLNRSMITDETEAVIAVLYTGNMMNQSITRDWIRNTVWTKTGNNAQHNGFLDLAYQHGIGTKKKK